jgi:hypothetical protein
MTKLERELLILLARVVRDGYHSVTRDDITALMKRIEIDAIARKSLRAVPD